MLANLLACMLFAQMSLSYFNGSRCRHSLSFVALREQDSRQPGHNLDPGNDFHFIAEIDLDKMSPSDFLLSTWTRDKVFWGPKCFGIC